jgi:hypothetical protein
VKSAWTKFVQSLAREVEAGNASRAAAIAGRMAVLLLPSQSAIGDLPAALWPGYVRLLESRGYFTAERIDGSLREIQDVGAGFDLFDLSSGLARCDAKITLCLRALPERAFPPLAPFAPECVCPHHQGGSP